ncbi:MAG TPA: DUF6067 family protein [Planctomycetota bacterium]|nr:DUF6067 family protein [Planctomycetota bacterium]HRR78542.1 DUF6067 family protein [Planctomycetota bacterium]
MLRVTTLSCFLVAAASAAELHSPTIALPLMAKAPTIDGAIGEEEWAGATRQIGFSSHGKRHLTSREGVFWLGSDGKELFIAVKTELPPEGGLLTRVQPKENVDVQAYRDDSLELWLDPFRKPPAGSQPAGGYEKRICYQIIVNALGAIYDIAHDKNKGMTSTAWRVNWRLANKAADGWWSVEIAIPLAALDFKGDLAGGEWGIRIGRNWQQPWEQSEWSPTPIAYDDPETMGVVRWDPAAPLVQMLELADAKANKAVLATRLTNPTDKPTAIKIALSNKHVDSPATEKSEDVALAPGESKTVRLDGSTYPKGDNLSAIAVTSADGKTTFFSRDFVWTLEKPETRWRVALHEREAIELAFGYYPYHDKLKARLDVSSLPAAKEVTGAALIIRGKGTGDILARIPMPPLKDGRSEVVAGLPRIAEGTYEVFAELAGGKGVPKQSPVKEFLRKVFPWEHNKLGISDKPMPPFTPLEVKGNVVRAVLREHMMNGYGLWEQVESLGTPLLAAPMVFSVAAQGGGGAGEPKLRKASDVSVLAEAKWSQNPIAAQVSSEFDVDGMMKVTLDAKPGNATPIEAFDLVIPLREEIAKLMHVCGDGLRFNYAGEVPKGEGVVWDSRKASRLEIAGTFIPYIWLGDEERGIAWFADSDEGWVLDDKKPALELIRRKGVVELRVHFINKPGPLPGPRKIVFGLQATPTKPMMQNPSWRRINSLVGKAPDFLRYHTLGATFYWGGIDFDVFPRDKDTSIYDKFAEIRRTGKEDRPFFENWLRKYGPDGQRDKMWDAHIWSGVSSFKGQPDLMIPYTNARGCGKCDDFTVFQDEWLVSDYTSRAATSVAYDIDPVPSFQDFALYYFEKMLDSGAFDGLYFDNTFLKANKNIVGGGAYVRDDGTLQPACGLWTMRDYLKRCAILCWQKGRPFVNISHMTNTQIVPINTWAGINLDWEWKYGDTDAHDRFAEDYVRATSIGLQTGSRPTVLLGLHETKKELQPWVARTCLAWCLVHEICPAWTYGEPFQTVFKKLYDFGYGTDACRVIRYWEKQPIRIEGIEAKALVVAKKGAVAVFITNIGQDGVCRLILDKSLGLAPDAGAVEAERGGAIERTGDSAYSFPLKRHDFTLLLIGQ